MQIDSYFGKTIKNPEGSYGHHGDCHVYGLGICTCGFLSCLSFEIGSDVLDVGSLYPNFYEEYAKHESILDELQRSKYEK